MGLLRQQWCAMAPIDLNHLRAFVAVFELGSFSKAAARLEVPRSTVSRALVALERGLKTELFKRTTRSVAVTDEGKALYDRVAPTLAGLELALVESPQKQEAPSGRLRMTATNDVGLAVLADAVSRFTARFPEVSCEVSLSPRVVDLVRDRFDLALRITSKTLKNAAGLSARKLGTLRAAWFASPAYVARHGMPTSLAELTQHEQVVFRGSANMPEPRGGTARILCDDTFFAREVTCRDAGIAILPLLIANEEVARGRLVRVMPEHAEHTGTIWLVQPRMKNPPSRVTAFRDLLVELLRQRPLE